MWHTHTHTHTYTHTCQHAGCGSNRPFSMHCTCAGAQPDRYTGMYTHTHTHAHTSSNTSFSCMDAAAADKGSTRDTTTPVAFGGTCDTHTHTHTHRVVQRMGSRMRHKNTQLRVCTPGARRVCARTNTHRHTHTHTHTHTHMEHTHTYLQVCLLCGVLHVL